VGSEVFGVCSAPGWRSSWVNRVKWWTCGKRRSIWGYPRILCTVTSRKAKYPRSNLEIVGNFGRRSWTAGWNAKWVRCTRAGV